MPVPVLASTAAVQAVCGSVAGSGAASVLLDVAILICVSYAWVCPCTAA